MTRDHLTEGIAGGSVPGGGGSSVYLSSKCFKPQAPLLPISRRLIYWCEVIVPVAQATLLRLHILTGLYAEACLCLIAQLAKCLATASFALM
jgi:hypothetical protein